MGRNSRLQPPALEECLTCLFPFVWFCFSFRPPTRSMVSAGKFLVRCLASMISREFDIDGTEHRENEGLQQTDQQLEEVKRQRKDNQRKPVKWGRQTCAHRTHGV